MGDGLKTVSSGTLKQAMEKGTNSPVLGFLTGVGTTFLIKSSSATIGILQTLASESAALTFGTVYTIIIGVNIGDCLSTALVCSIGSKADAKRAGLVHVIFNLFALVVVLAGVFLLRQLGALDAIWDKTIKSGGVANVHTLFRLTSAVLLLPFVNTFERIACRLVKDDKAPAHKPDAELVHMDEKLFSSPALALSSAARGITAMAELARKNLSQAMACFDKFDSKAIEEIQAEEERLDSLADKVDVYLLHLAPNTPKGELYDKLNYYTQCFSELERIGDHAVNLTEAITELYENGDAFSPTTT